jgi:hypothetical protein
MNIQRIARQFIKSELSRRELNYQDLEEHLTAAGYPVKREQIANRLSRGVYKIEFFIQCMKVLGVKQVSLDQLYEED